MNNDTICDPSGYCQGFCPAGHFCPEEGTIFPIPCDLNTNMAVIGGSELSQCFICQPGDWCKKGYAEPTECPQGIDSEIFLRQTRQIL